MPSFDLTLRKEPVEENVYETDEFTVPAVWLAGIYKTHVVVPDAIPYDGSHSLKATTLYFEPGLDEWIEAGGMANTLDPPGGGNEPVEVRDLWYQAWGSREGADPSTKQHRKVIFDLINGKRVKVRLTMPTFFDCAVSIENTQRPEALKGSLAIQVDSNGDPILDKDGKPERRADVGVTLERHHSISLVENQDASANALTADTASWTVTANNTVVIVAGSNGNATTDHTMAVSGTLGSGFTSRIRSAYSDESVASGLAEGFTAQRHAGGTGVITLTRNGASNNGIAFSCTEASGVEATFSGATASISIASARAQVQITPRSTGGYIFAAAADWNTLGAFTAGTGETLDLNFSGTNTTVGCWHSTSTVTKGTMHTSDDGAAVTTRQMHTIALELCPLPTVALSGTITATITEADIVAGSKTAILTVTDGVWAPATDIVFVGKQKGIFAGTTTAQTVTFNLKDGIETTPAAGDLVVAGYSIGSTVARTPIIEDSGGTDYTSIGLDQRSDTFDSSMRAAYKFMGSTPDTQIQFTETGGGTGSTADAGAWVVLVFRYVDTGTPMDVAAVVTGAINSSTVDPASITPSTSGAFIVVMGAAASTTGAVMNAPYLSGVVAATSPDTNDTSILGGFLPWTGGAYNPAAFTNIPGGTTSNSWNGFSIALRPGTRFNNTRASYRTAFDSAQAEATGWDARETTILPDTAFVRTSDTVMTATAVADASYDITAQETITVSAIPATCFAWGSDTITPSSNTFTIDTSGAAVTQPTMRRWGGVPHIRNIMGPKIFGRTWIDGERRYPEQAYVTNRFGPPLRARAPQSGWGLCLGRLRTSSPVLRGNHVDWTGGPPHAKMEGHTARGGFTATVR